MPRSELEFIEIETYVLKVHINCQGCRHKVKKLLRKIEGVCAVKIDEDGERVMVSGIVDPNTLISKLLRSGKHAELCSPNPTIHNNSIQQLPIKDNINDNNINMNQLQQLLLMNPHDHHNFSPPSFGSPLGGQGEVDQMMMYMDGDGHGGHLSQGYGLYGYGDDHQSGVLPIPMMMNNNPLQSPMMYDDRFVVHHHHQPYAYTRSSLVSPSAHYSFFPPCSYY